MTTTRIDGLTVTVSLEVSVEYDSEGGGFLVCEKDGPHVIKWGPMPGFLVQAFIRERGEHVASTWRRCADEAPRELR